MVSMLATREPLLKNEPFAIPNFHRIYKARPTYSEDCSLELISICAAMCCDFTARNFGVTVIGLYVVDS